MDTKIPKQIRVLYVEDILDTQKDITKLLEECGFFVMPYSDGKKVIDDIHEGLKYDVAVIDRSLEFSFSCYSGEDIMEESKNCNPHVKIICTTGYDDFPREADKVLIKPFDYDTLVNSIEDCLVSKSDKDIVQEGKKKSPWAQVYEW